MSFLVYCSHYFSVMTYPERLPVFRPVATPFFHGTKDEIRVMFADWVPVARNL